MERWADLSTENSLKTDLAHRTAEMGGIGGTTDAELRAFFEKIGNKTIITKDEKLIAFFEEWEKNRSSMSPNGDLIDTKIGEYIMWNQGTVRVSKDYGPRELSLIDKAGLGLANFFFLDDWKTVWNSEASIGERGYSAFSLSPQGKVVSWGVSFVKESIVGKIVKSGKVPNKSVDKVEDVGDRVEGIDKTRPSWGQSEIDVEKDFPEYNAQKSFKDGKEVPYGEKGSSRPDMYQTGRSIEVKNYKITTSSGRRNLVNNVSKQVEKKD